MPPKPILVAARLRRPPATGWSWVDRRFVREHMADLSREAVLLYFFLAAVADKHGLSFYGDGTLATLLRMTPPALIEARGELLARDLIAHEVRFTQVLSLPPPGQTRRCALAKVRHNWARSCTGHHDGTCPRGKELAMNVALWAEIRRLAEIEKLSGWAISRRLHCSRHTVAAALALDQPPARRLRAAPASWTRTGPRSMHCWLSIPNSRRCHPRGDRSQSRRLYRQRLHASPLPPAGPSRARSRLPGSSLRAGPGDAGRLGRMWPRAARRHDPQGFGVCGFALL